MLFFCSNTSEGWIIEQFEANLTRYYIIFSAKLLMNYSVNPKRKLGKGSFQLASIFASQTSFKRKYKYYWYSHKNNYTDKIRQYFYTL